MALAADGRTALSTVRGKKLKLWDVDSGRELRALAGKYGSVRAVALSRDLQGAGAVAVIRAVLTRRNSKRISNASVEMAFTGKWCSSVLSHRSIKRHVSKPVPPL